MMSIKEYFENLYKNAKTEEEFFAVMDEEIDAYETEDLEAWAKEHNVDLTIMGKHGITELQYWAWNFDD